MAFPDAFDHPPNQRAIELTLPISLLFDFFSEIGEIIRLQFSVKVVFVSYPERGIKGVNMLLYSCLQMLTTLKGRVVNSPLRQGQFRLGGWVCT